MSFELFLTGSRLVFLTRTPSECRCVNMRLWSSQRLTNASTILHFFRFTQLSCPAARLPTRAPTHPPIHPVPRPTLQNMATMNDNYTAGWMKSQRTTRLFEMTFTSAPPQFLSQRPPVCLTYLTEKVFIWNIY